MICRATWLTLEPVHGTSRSYFMNSVCSIVLFIFHILTRTHNFAHAQKIVRGEAKIESKRSGEKGGLKEKEREREN